MIETEESSVDVSAAVEMANADKLSHAKEQLATKIREIIKDQKWTQQQTSNRTGIPQSKLSRIFRGQFHGVSASKMLDCLVQLGCDIEIVVGPARCVASTGKLTVSFE